MKLRGLCVFASFLCGYAWSAEANLSLQQMNHRGWTITDGAPGEVSAITQTTDGTLWIASMTGLFRFDGTRFFRCDESVDQPFESSNISELLALADGGLWIGFRFGGLGLLKDGRFVRYGEQDGLPEGTVKAILQDPSGVMYAATTRGLARLRGSRWERILIDPMDPSVPAFAAGFDRKGTLWVATNTRIFARTTGNGPFHEVEKLPYLHLRSNSHSFAMASDGMLWTTITGAPSDADGARGRTEPLTIVHLRSYPTSDSSIEGPILFDHEDNLWFADEAVKRVSFAAPGIAVNSVELAQHAEAFDITNGLTVRSPSCFFEDREGNIWVGTEAGIDRFRKTNIARIVQNRPGGVAMVAGDAGILWAAVAEKTERVSGGHSSPLLEVRNGSVVEEHRAPWFTSAYRASDNTLWFGGPTGIAHLDDGKLSTIELPEPVKNQEVQALVRDRTDAIWVSVVRKGIFRLSNGQWTPYGNLDALPRVPAIVESADDRGTLWFGYTNSRVARIDGTVVKLLGADDGLNVGNVTAIEARRGHVWIGGERALARFDGSRFALVRSASGNPFIGISGIIETAGGDLWLNGITGIIHISRTEVKRAVSDAAHRVLYETFDHLDGLSGVAMQLRPTPSAVEGTDGRLWFSTDSGVVSIDPGHMRRNPLVPPVIVWAITSDGIRYDSHAKRIRLPAHTSNVQVEYSAGSLTIPERVRFRYRLQGLDHNWQDGGNRRDVFYTNLGPGYYTFHVIASNNDGVWNNIGASLEFSIIPAFYQTWWFYAVCALIGMTCVYLLYKVRVRQLGARVRARLEERVAERERIARELHDTLLQGVQGLVLRFQAVANRIPAGEPTHCLLERALERADQMLCEGRDRVRDLRGSDSDAGLPHSLAAAGKQLSLAHAAQFLAKVEGTPRDLHAIVREETLFIAREALANAFRHANASQVEAEVCYNEHELRVSIRDDGCGIDPEVLRKGGRAGHWGLLGMRERADKIRGTVTIWSKPGAGTEIDVRIPAQVAYRAPIIRRDSWLVRNVTFSFGGLNRDNQATRTAGPRE